jgi:hypothetical protein
MIMMKMILITIIQFNSLLFMWGFNSYKTNYGNNIVQILSITLLGKKSTETTVTDYCGGGSDYYYYDDGEETA